MSLLLTKCHFDGNHMSDLGLCWLHIHYCWKSHVTAQSFVLLYGQLGIILDSAFQLHEKLYEEKANPWQMHQIQLTALYKDGYC